MRSNRDKMRSNSERFIPKSQSSEVLISYSHTHHQSQAQQLKEKDRIVVHGDSLSERGEMAQRDIAGCISMNVLSGLKGKSPDGSFTNGLPWSDFFACEVAAELDEARIHKEHQGKELPYEDEDIIADEIITHEFKTQLVLDDAFAHSEDANHPLKKTESDSLIQHGKIIKKQKKEPLDEDFTLTDYKEIQYRKKTWMQFYCEGGMTSADYKDKVSFNLPRFFSRKILTNLNIMRQRLFNNDALYGRTLEEKSKTLVIEWSGANDLITVTVKEAEAAVKARLQNVREHAAKGYTDFVLFNLPDLSLTPRFQALSEAEQVNASYCCSYFNRLLEEGIKELNNENPSINVHLFDINSRFKELYDNPQDHDFEPEKLKTPYLTSKDFKMIDGDISPAPGYFFWDDVHPTAHTHAQLASEFYDWVTKIFHFKEPTSQHEKLVLATEDDILKRYTSIYRYEITKKMAQPLGCIGNSHFDYEHASLKEVIDYGMDGGNRTLSILIRMGVLNKLGKPNMEIPAVRIAMEGEAEDVYTIPLRRANMG